jgi:DNA-directed RNA polymerase subunit M/transcription elongation factor TFIIS
LEAVLKHFLWLFLIFCTNSLANDEVYRWVDKKGVVNYSDKPKNATAKIVNFKKSSSNTSVSNVVQVPKKKEVKKVLSAEDQEYCNYIFEQIKLAEENATSFNELKVSYAQAYLKTSQKVLKDNNCI